MAKTSGLDDLIRVILRQARSKPLKKIRQDMASSAGGGLLYDYPSSPFPRSKPKGKPNVKAEPVKPKGKGKGKGGASGVKAKTKPKSKSPAGGSARDIPKVGRFAKTRVQPKPIDTYPKGKTIAQSESEQRAAERMANRYLRMKGGKGPAGDGKKPVDVKGSIISPPSKATLRQPKPRGSKSFEADPMRRLEGTPKPPKPSKRKPNQPKGTKPSQGTKKSKAGTTVRSSVKPKATMSSGSAQGRATRERDRVARQEVQHSKKIQDAIRSEWTKRRQERINQLQAIIRDPKVKPAARSKAVKEMSEISRLIMKGK